MITIFFPFPTLSSPLLTTPTEPLLATSPLLLCLPQDLVSSSNGGIDYEDVPTPGMTQSSYHHHIPALSSFAHIPSESAPTILTNQVRQIRIIHYCPDQSGRETLGISSYHSHHLGKANTVIHCDSDQ